MSKKKLKLTSEQKERLKNLKEYIEKTKCYVGDADLKDLIQDGKYAVFGVRAPIFDSIIICDSEETAHNVCDFNPNSHSKIVDIDKGELLQEEEKGWIPRKNS